jgi:hypothetical protein
VRPALPKASQRIDAALPWRTRPVSEASEQERRSDSQSGRPPDHQPASFCVNRTLHRRPARDRPWSRQPRTPMATSWDSIQVSYAVPATAPPKCTRHTAPAACHNQHAQPTHVIDRPGEATGHVANSQTCAWSGRCACDRQCAAAACCRRVRAAGWRLAERSPAGAAVARSSIREAT